MLKLICYDIENDRLRTWVSKYLERQGLTRLQYSVFVGTLTREQWATLWTRVHEQCTAHFKDDDSLYCMILSKGAFQKVQQVGKTIDTDFILDEGYTLYL